nr:ETC complex I subunit [Telmatospirillum sp. J64-1]
MMARIYRPSPSPTQSGRARSREWVMEFEPSRPLIPDHLMGWVSSDDTRRQVKMRFPDKESAIRFAERQGWAYSVREVAERRIRLKSYADNFRWQGGGEAQAAPPDRPEQAHEDRRNVA